MKVARANQANAAFCSFSQSFAPNLVIYFQDGLCESENDQTCRGAGDI